MGTETTKYRIVLDDRLTPELRKALTQANAFDNKMKAVQGTTKRTGNALARAFGGVAILAGVTAVTRSIIKLGAEMEQTRIRFETFTGSAVIGNQLVDQLNEFSKVTTFTNREVLKAGNALLGYGLSAGELLPTMKMLGDVSAGTGKNLQELGIIFGQIRGENKLNAQDWRQLVTAGFNPLQNISERTGKSIATLRKEMSLGLISFAQVKQAFIDATSEGGRFYNMNEKLSKTLAGRWSTLVGTLQLLGAEIGQQQTGGLNAFLERLNNFLVDRGQMILNVFQTIGNSFKSLVNALVQVANAFGLADNAGDLFAKSIAGIGFSVAGLVEIIGVLVKSIPAAGLAITALAEYLGGNTIAGKGLMSAAGGMFDNALTSFGQQMEKHAEMSGLNALFGADRTGNKANTSHTVADAGGTGVGNVNGTSTTGAGSSRVSGMQSKVRNITVNIQKMVENINFNNMTSQQSEAAMVEAVKKALLTAINDVNIIAR